MRSRNLLVMILGVAAVLFSACPTYAQTKSTYAQTKKDTDRPGDAIYTPTKLEWAAVELQSGWGKTAISSHVTMNFQAGPDGKTVLCIIQYPPDVPAAEVKQVRDSSQYVFDRYVANRKWPWLRIQFEEDVLPAPTP